MKQVQQSVLQSLAVLYSLQLSVLQSLAVLYSLQLSVLQSLAVLYSLQLSVLQSLAVLYSLQLLIQPSLKHKFFFPQFCLHIKFPFIVFSTIYTPQTAARLQTNAVNHSKLVSASVLVQSARLGSIFFPLLTSPDQLCGPLNRI